VTVYDPYGAGGIGVLRHRLTIEAAVDMDDDAGGTTRIWQVVGQLWAMIEPVRGQTEDIAQARDQVVTHRVTARWRNDIDGNTRLTLGARVFQIQAAFDPDGTSRRLICLVQEVKA
jgi:SPP1 family predicted phage head-tail adaptor